MTCPTCGSSMDSDACAVCGTESVAANYGATDSSTVSHDRLDPGRTLAQGRFVIKSVLGQGGFGITYRAHDLRLQRWVAMKEFFPAGCIRVGDTVHPATTWAASFEQVRQRFIGEATTLAQLRHPGIVPVYEVIEDLGTAYIVMEYVAGPTLDRLVDEHGRLSPADAEDVLRQVGSALSYIHSRSVLHRDISPSNIICYEGRYILIDFGAAREYMADQSSALSQIVKPGYSPLEQYSGHGVIGPPTDIYALCATAYFVLTGQRPMDATARVTGTALVPIRDLVEAVPTPLIAALDQGLAIRPMDRPPTVQALLELIASQSPPPPAPGRFDSPASAPTEVVDVVGVLPSGPGPKTRNRGMELVALAAAVAIAVVLIVVLVRPGTDSTTDIGAGPTTVTTAEATAAPSTTPLTSAVPVTDPSATVVAAASTPTPESPPPTDPKSVSVVPTNEAASSPFLKTGRVSRTCGAGGNGDCFVTVRSGPSARSASVRRVDEGQPIDVLCQVRGGTTTSSVLGMTSTIWVRTADGNYAANIYLDVPGFRLDRISVPC